jgi:membrane protein YdbS with pleckstrin-like domain
MSRSMKRSARRGAAPLLIATAVVLLAASSMLLVRIAPNVSAAVNVTVVVVLLGVLALLFLMVITRDEERGLRDFAREFLATPQAVIRQNLGPTEYVLHTARPATWAFVLRNLTMLLLGAIVGLIAIGIGLVVGGLTGLAIVLFVIPGLAVAFLTKRFSEYYTLYVFTDDRVMKLSGVLTRSEASINWERVTDIAWEQSFSGRLFGFATLRVDSANEKAALKELRDIPNRAEVNQVVTERLDLRYRAGQG